MPINVGYNPMPQQGLIDLDAVALRRRQFQAQQQQQAQENMMKAVEMVMNFAMKNKEMQNKQAELKQQQETYKSMIGTGDYEVSGFSGGQPRLKKTKENYKQEDIAVMKNILTGGTEKPMQVRIKSTSTMDTTNLPTIDLNTPEGMEQGASLIFGEEKWRDDPQLIKHGLIDLYDKRLELLKTKAEKVSAESEPKLEPFGKGIERATGKAYYKDAAAKYGDDKATKIVDIAVKLQKQGMSIAKIKKLMEEQGIDPNLVFGAYGK